jgi:hypothetical protein
LAFFVPHFDNNNSVRQVHHPPELLISERVRQLYSVAIQGLRRDKPCLKIKDWNNILPYGFRFVQSKDVIYLNHLTQNLLKKPENRGVGIRPHPCFRVTLAV